jgi:hypothetical protein
VQSHFEGALRILKSAEIGAMHWIKDRASSNARVWAKLVNTWSPQLPNTGFSEGECGHHCNHSGVGYCLVEHMGTIRKIYSLSSLCGMGATFVRVLSALPAVCANMLASGELVISRCAPPPRTPQEELFIQEALAYLRFHREEATEQRSRRRKRTAATKLTKPVSTAKAAEKERKVAGEEKQRQTDHQQAWEDLFGMFVGWLTGQLTHHCASYECCQGHDRAVFLRRLVGLLLRSVFVSQVCSPELGKWTKLGPALDKIVCARFAGAFQAAAFTQAFQEGTKVALKTQTGITGEDVDDAYLQEVHFNEVRGKRCKASIELLSSDADQMILLIKAISLESFRALSRIFFTYASSEPPHKRHMTSVPGLLNFTSDAFSPVVSVLQYVSSFLTMESGSRLVLVLGLLKCTSQQELWHRHKEPLFQAAPAPSIESLELVSNQKAMLQASTPSTESIYFATGGSCACNSSNSFSYRLLLRLCLQFPLVNCGRQPQRLDFY